jgi:hypothetical protein
MALSLKSTGISFGDFAHFSTAVAETLNDYEEGTVVWSPSSFSISSHHHSEYTKIARTVTLVVYLVVNSGTTGNASMAGAPFVTKTNGYACTQLNHADTNHNNPHVRIASASTTINFLKDSDTNQLGNEMDASHVIFALTYIAA